MKRRDYWQEDAACRGMDPNIFMPLETGGAITIEVRDHNARAKAICARCPVVEQCKALVRTDTTLRKVPTIRSTRENGAPRADWLGVFGGETAYERAKVLRRNKAKRTMQSTEETPILTTSPTERIYA